MEIYNYTAKGVSKSEKINPKTPTWVDVVDPTDDDLKYISENLDIPLFALKRCREDIRPKLEVFDGFVFLNFKIVKREEDIAAKQISIFFSEKWLITMHPKIDAIAVIREGVEKGERKRLRSGLDYVLYAILDELIETFFPLMDKMDVEVDAIEDEIFKEPKPNTLERIFALKRSIIQLHKVLWAEREVLLNLQKGVSGIKKTNLIYFRDLYDRIIQLIDAEEVSRDILTGALDSYLSAASNRMNEIMKTLTVIATIMMPLTLITGIYGMNFSYMPELYHPWGYFGTMAFMVMLGVLMLFYFRRRGWF